MQNYQSFNRNNFSKWSRPRALWESNRDLEMIRRIIQGRPLSDPGWIDRFIKILQAHKPAAPAPASAPKPAAPTIAEQARKPIVTSKPAAPLTPVNASKPTTTPVTPPTQPTAAPVKSPTPAAPTAPVKAPTPPTRKQ